MIPKIIHLCWFGGKPLPPLAKECVASWRKFLPGYRIVQWSEERYIDEARSYTLADEVRVFDVDMIPYTAEAYRLGKYAFVSDYARFWIIYHFGGVYFDTDVEVVRPMDPIIVKGNFMGFEVDPDGENTPGRYAPRFSFAVALGLGFGMESGHWFMKRMLDHYAELRFELPPTDITWYKTIVAHTTEQLCSLGLKNVSGIQRVHDITVYPCEYFAPINVMTGRLHVTEHTYTIHRYMGSWNAGKMGIKERVKHWLKGLIPEKMFVWNNRIKRRRYRILQNETSNI